MKPLVQVRFHFGLRFVEEVRKWEQLPSSAFPSTPRHGEGRGATCPPPPPWTASSFSTRSAVAP